MIRKVKSFCFGIKSLISDSSEKNSLISFILAIGRNKSIYLSVTSERVDKMSSSRMSPMQQELLRRRLSKTLTSNPHMLTVSVPNLPHDLVPHPEEQPMVNNDTPPTRSAGHASMNRGSPMQQHLRRLRQEQLKPKLRSSSFASSSEIPAVAENASEIENSPLMQNDHPFHPNDTCSLPRETRTLHRRPSLSPASETFIPPTTTSYGTALRRRKALLVGIGYRNHRLLRPLPGCRTDVCSMFALITGPLFGFPTDSVRVLCDELQQVGDVIVSQPTRINILRDLRWLTTDVSPGESVFFFFAGHGDFVEDLSGDEIESGFDQVCIRRKQDIKHKLYRKNIVFDALCIAFFPFDY